jgi:hypothetical protein
MNSGSGSGNSTSDDDLAESNSGVRSRSWTSWNAGSVACIAGVMRFGSEGRFFNIDCRISRDCRVGGEAGDSVEASRLALNCQCVSKCS